MFGGRLGVPAASARNAALETTHAPAPRVAHAQKFINFMKNFQNALTCQKPAQDAKLPPISPCESKAWLSSPPLWIVPISIGDPPLPHPQFFGHHSARQRLL